MRVVTKDRLDTIVQEIEERISAERALGNEVIKVVLNDEEWERFSSCVFNDLVLGVPICCE